MRFIGDSDLKPEYICTKRSAKFATFESVRASGEIRRKIKTDFDGFEYVVDGNYSMAPSINSKHISG